MASGNIKLCIDQNNFNFSTCAAKVFLQVFPQTRVSMTTGVSFDIILRFNAKATGTSMDVSQGAALNITGPSDAWVDLTVFATWNHASEAIDEFQFSK